MRFSRACLACSLCVRFQSFRVVISRDFKGVGLHCKKAGQKKSPDFSGFHWRWEAELNRCRRICSPQPNRSAIPPVELPRIISKRFSACQPRIDDIFVTTPQAEACVWSREDRRRNAEGRVRRRARRNTPRVSSPSQAAPGSGRVLRRDRIGRHSTDVSVRP